MSAISTKHSRDIKPHEHLKGPEGNLLVSWAIIVLGVSVSILITYFPCEPPNVSEWYPQVREPERQLIQAKKPETEDHQDRVSESGQAIYCLKDDPNYRPPNPLWYLGILVGTWMNLDAGPVRELKLKPLRPLNVRSEEYRELLQKLWMYDYKVGVNGSLQVEVPKRDRYGWILRETAKAFKLSQRRVA